MTNYNEHNSGRSSDYWEGVEHGKRHKYPSRGTLDAVRKLEDKIDDNHKEVMVEIKEIKSTQSEFDKRAVTWDYSSKTILAMLGLIVTSFFVAVINFFIK